MLLNNNKPASNCQADPCICQRMDSGPHNELEAIDILIRQAKERYETLCFNELKKLAKIAYQGRALPDIAIIAGHTWVGSLPFESSAEACEFVRMLIIALDAKEQCIPF